MEKKTLKEIPKVERPREKLIEKGVENLKDEELLAILLRTGAKNKNVLDLSQQILRKFSKKKFLKLKLDDLIKIKGINKAKASTILAAIEFTKRILNLGEETLPKVKSKQDVIAQLGYLREKAVSLWFVTKNKKNGRFRNRMGETLFIDAREIYTPISRKQVTFTDEQIQKIANTVRAWRGEKDAGKYEDIPGFCKSATIEEIKNNGYVLTPGRYVGIPPQPDDGIPFEEKMKKLTLELREYFKEEKDLKGKILNNLKRLGY